MKILFLSAEADPFIKVGGLGDVAGSLPGALKTIQPELDIRLCIPRHQALKLDGFKVEPYKNFELHRNQITSFVKVEKTNKDEVAVFVIDGEPFSRSQKVYESDVALDGEKYFFFSLASIEFAELDDWIPDIVVANDWHTAIAVVDVKSRHLTNAWKNTKTIFMIHNLGYMGAGTNDVLSRFGVAELPPSNLPWWGNHMPLPMAAKLADKIVTVSPTYANEIKTAEYGCGLQDFFVSRSYDLIGIINGIDLNLWNPERDSAIPASFNKDDLAGKLINKKSLQSEFGFEKDPDVPLFAIITRMDQQKGVDLLVDSIKYLEDENFQLIILGTGDQKLEQKSVLLEIRYPGKVKTLIKYDSKLSRNLYAGADLVLMPSRYEPCGIAQMISMRYGTVPLARTTGGLKDTIRDRETGFLFNELSPEALAQTMRKAIKLFADKKSWKQLQQNCMEENFSWQVSARKYLDLFKSM
ncbi:MAG TPA: glycogen synthase [Anaerolineales bacterium]|nr:glycogen synthase [Anaerolineales bacterium]